MLHSIFDTKEAQRMPLALCHEKARPRSNGCGVAGLARNEDHRLLPPALSPRQPETDGPLKLIPIYGGVIPSRETPPKAQFANV